MLAILFVMILILTSILFNIFVKKFKIKKIYYIISIILPSICLLYTRWYVIEFLLFLIIFEILTILSFVDIKYLEIDGKSYSFILIPSIVQFLFFSKSYLLGILSVLLVYFTFWIFDKMVGIEQLGGADVKIILILSLYFSASDIFSFIMYSFGISLLIFLILALKNKTFKDIKVPMIVAINISFFIQKAFLI